MVFSRASRAERIGLHAYLAKIIKRMAKPIVCQIIKPKSGLIRSIVIVLLRDCSTVKKGSA
jgi:hypothetical protein